MLAFKYLFFTPPWESGLKYTIKSYKMKIKIKSNKIEFGEEKKKLFSS